MHRNFQLYKRRGVCRGASREKRHSLDRTRIQELDIFRGICLLGVYAAHIYFDAAALCGAGDAPRSILLLFEYGGILFVLLSGICVTLGAHCVRRGGVVLGCAALVTAVSMAAAALTGDPSLAVHFGILHLLGCCMLLYPLFRRLPLPALLAAAAAVLALGFFFDTLRVPQPWLFPIGLTTSTYEAADYWPLFPYLGFFLLGAAAGRTLYREKKPRIPALQGRLRPLAFLGRHCLLLYLLQQPLTLLLLLPFTGGAL